MDVIIGIAIAVILGAKYRRSLIRHPKQPCPHCNGDARHWDDVWQPAFGDCRYCKRRGWKVRPGVRLFMPRMAQDIEIGGHGRYY